MCDTIEAESPADAREAWESKFWASPEEFSAAIPGMDATNAECAKKLLANMLLTREDARKWGITVTARPSRAKTPFGTMTGVR